MKLVKTVPPAVLCNEITMDGLQWLFIPELHSDFIRLREKGRNKGRRERKQTAGIKSSQRREMGCREMGGAEGKENIRMNE